MMTDKEIIKALEQCGNIIVSSCKDCPFHEKYNANCVRELTKEALDLINRQKAEIDYWKRNAFDGCMERGRIYQNAKSEAYKKITESVKAHMCSYDLDNYHSFRAIEEEAFDDLVKELMEGKDDENL